MNDNDESFELQNCIQHQRKFECFCTECSTLICPSCLMFGQHKGHQVCTIEESMRSMRNELDDAAKEGLFKVENSEKILIEIRDIKLTVEDKKNKIIEEIEQVFSQLIQTLKERKSVVINNVNEHFSQQLNILNENENKWFFLYFNILLEMIINKFVLNYQILLNVKRILKQLKMLILLLGVQIHQRNKNNIIKLNQLIQLIKNFILGKKAFKQLMKLLILQKIMLNKANQLIFHLEHDINNFTNQQIFALNLFILNKK